MKIFCRFTFIAYLSFVFFQSFSQTTDTCHLRISLLTCGPGEELYSTFGHTAIRVIDSSTRLDIVFNYGTFDTSDPYFYVKFTRGIMRYALSAYDFPNFMQEYVEDNRSVTEQVLSLSCEEKIHLYEALKNNASEENRYYGYQFYLDNCTTRAKNMIEKNSQQPIVFKNILSPQSPSFRNLINNYLDSSHLYWAKFGINLLLGSNLDKKPTNEQAMFLPDYLMKGLDSASIQQQPLVNERKLILKSVGKPESASLFTPFIMFTALAVFFFLLSFSKNKTAQKVLHISDIIFFLIIGLLGLLITTVWLIRVDEVCRNNLNILWCLPTNVVMAFFTKKDKPWVKKYFLVAGSMALLLLLGWSLLPQELNIAFAPLLFIIAVRSFFISIKK